MAKLPSFTALRAFEAAVRHRSMSKAAEELSVTHSAISKQIQYLEQELGTALLQRLPRSVEPTEAGMRLAAPLAAAFSLMETGIAQVRPGPLALSCSVSLMTRWLIPRLSRFQADSRGINLRLSAAHGPIDLVREGIDLALRNDVISPPDDIIVKRLAPELVGPVCSPEYFHSHCLETLDDLRAARILTNASRPGAWAEWLELMNWRNAPLEGHETYAHFHLAIQSASMGLGVAMSPSLLVADDLLAGRLVAPFGFVKARRHLELWMTDQVRRREEVKAFALWLQEETAATHSSLSGYVRPSLARREGRP
ncbi:LysR family transcriptional regulator [Alcaligenaceae bacterium]|nr:LysR family transcriptional regulator [Alcaligenaceae bacterium]